MTEAIVEVAGLTKRYRRAPVNAVDNVSFSVDQGEFFALLGPNGAGKTTTISILTTTLAPTSGEVRIAGRDIHRDPAIVRRAAGIIFQNASLDMNLSGEENVRMHAILYGLFPYRPAYALMPAAYRNQIRDLAAVLGLDEGDMFRPVKKLSGGMRRKLEIIRGLMHRPRVLFLDEPTAGLDAASRRALWEYIEEVRRRDDLTVFLTTHYLEEAEVADRVCILTHGQVAAIGTPASVKGQLASPTLILDADDRAALHADLDRLGLTYRTARHVEVDMRHHAPSRIVNDLTVPLTYLRTRDPSLEDAYLRIVGTDE